MKTKQDIFQETVRTIVENHTHRLHNPEYAQPFPSSLGIKLTNRCNMRCAHCYQWNDEGHHHLLSEEQQKQDLEVALFEKILKESAPYDSRLYLWGGEPFYHHRFPEIVDLVGQQAREVVFCTNGTFLLTYLDALRSLKQYVEYLIPVEGFPSAHDAIRGNGNFLRVQEGVQALCRARDEKSLNAKITIHTVIHPQNVSTLYELAEYFEKIWSVDFLIFCFPWYISPQTTEEMDRYCLQYFPGIDPAVPKSWYGFKYHLDSRYQTILQEQMKKIKARKWRMGVRFQPDLLPEEIGDFLEDRWQNLFKGKYCLGLSCRTDIHPDGTVTACKQFQEFEMGNVKEETLTNIWRGERYNAFRRTLANSLMPVCSKCNVLCLHSGL